MDSTPHQESEHQQLDQPLTAPEITELLNLLAEENLPILMRRQAA